MIGFGGNTKAYGELAAARETPVPRRLTAYDALRVVFTSIVVLYFCSSFAKAMDEKPTVETVQDTQTQRQICGVYALYSYLRSIGQEPDYQEIMRALSPGPRGNNLAELRDAAHQFGVELEICKTSPENRRAMQQGPFIAHMRKMRVTPDRFSEVAYDGHFVAVLPQEWWRKLDEIDAIDGTSGRIQAYSYAGFPKLWTGYYLTEKKKWHESYWLEFGLLVIIIGMVWYILKQEFVINV